MSETWDSSEKWYSSIVGEKGHYYHQTVVLPKSLQIIGKCKSMLDLGCGQGVLARALPESVDYYGVDQSQELVKKAKSLTQRGQFFVSDVTQEIPIEKKDFDQACFILSLQNMEEGEKAILNASKHLKKGGKLLVVLNHPCFRIPRQSDWGFDDKSKLQYRRMNLYMSAQKIPILTSPGQKENSSVTYTYHHNLSDIVGWFKKANLLVSDMQEWISDKKSEGAKARMEDRARKEFPLFLAILGVK